MNSILQRRRRFWNEVEDYLRRLYSPAIGGTFVPEFYQTYMLKTDAMWDRRERKAQRRYQRQKRKQ